MVKAQISVFEMSLRDGLQNEPTIPSVQTKIRFAQKLIEAGVLDFELGAFVRPDRVPQMADTEKLFQAVQKKKLHLKKGRAWALVPNRKGLERALSVGVKHIAIFTAATESFAQKNIGMSIRDSLTEYRSVIRDARAKGVLVRGYVSTAFGCPFEGKVKPSQVLKVIDALGQLEVSQISIGDTIGVATPNQVAPIISPALQNWGVDRIAVHFHDTRGTALANTLRSIQLGVSVVDSSAGGLGGCPFAPGAAGNLATEDLVYMLDGMGMKTGIHLEKLALASLEFAKKMNRPLSSRYLQAYAMALRPRARPRPRG